MIIFDIIGGGWRAEFYLRIAQACPEIFGIAGMVVRDAEKGAKIEKRWGVPTFRNTDDLLSSTDPHFVVTSVPAKINPDVVKDLVGRGLPVLSETAPGPTLEAMIDLYQFVQEHRGIVQVAEQYHLQPMHYARIALAQSGRLGAISQAQVSYAHGYHGLSLIRRLLGIGYEDATIRAMHAKGSIVKGPDRKGPPQAEEVVNSKPQTIAWLDFDGRLGVLDFTPDQYMSYVRGKRLLVRGERGEMNEERATVLRDYRTPLVLPIVRHAAGADGNLEGNYLKAVQFGEEILYRNPYVPASLTDDELAIAACLSAMEETVRSGKDFYSLAEASQDQYLNLLVEQAARTGETIRTQRQIWAS